MNSRRNPEYKGRLFRRKIIWITLFAVRVLKALFLVKYVKEFKSTGRNLCVLMLDDFNQDIPALRKNVEEVLNLPEQQACIQRNGEQYE